MFEQGVLMRGQGHHTRHVSNTGKQAGSRCLAGIAIVINYLIELEKENTE